MQRRKPPRQFLQGPPSGQASPSVVVEVTREKRPHEEEPREVVPWKNPRVDSAGGPVVFTGFTLV
ncbi:hypothetical protein A2U01_0109234, partial [Trifolium medium]|nr:hypothetical protein [Trifolium medium]